MASIANANAVYYKDNNGQVYQITDGAKNYLVPASINSIGTQDGSAYFTDNHDGTVEVYWRLNVGFYYGQVGGQNMGTNGYIYKFLSINNVEIINSTYWTTDMNFSRNSPISSDNSLVGNISISNGYLAWTPNRTNAPYIAYGDGAGVVDMTVHLTVSVVYMQNII